MNKTKMKSTIKKQCLILLVLLAVFVNTVGAMADLTGLNMRVSAFPDVKINAYYYDDLQLLLDLNIVNGFSNGLFYPERTVSRAEFIKMLVLAADYTLVEKSTYIFEDVVGHWSAPYVNAAMENNVIAVDLSAETANFFPDTPITRRDMSAFMIKALDIYSYSAAALYSDTDNKYINLASSEYLLMGYNEDGKKIFKPNESLIRADACMVIARIIKYREDAEAYKTDMVWSFIRNNVITTEHQLGDLLKACATYVVDEVTVQTILSAEEIESAFKRYIAITPEKPSIRSVYYESDEVTTSKFTFNYDISRAVEEDRMSQVEKAADEFVQKYIHQNMTDAEKVSEIHKYLVLNCVFDETYRYVTNTTAAYDFDIAPFTAYGALINKVAVCQGYAAAFNILAKKSGIKAIAISGTPPNSNINHMWNMVCIDDVIYFVDTTWDASFSGDNSKKGYETTHLLKTEEEFREFGYRWDAGLVQRQYLNK